MNDKELAQLISESCLSLKILHECNIARTDENYAEFRSKFDSLIVPAAAGSQRALSELRRQCGLPKERY